MKFFHISDLHIGKQLYHYNLLPEQRDTLEQITELARTEQPDAILIAGDIYDTSVPSAEAVSVFDAFLTDLGMLEKETAICIIAGNHDSAKRIDFANRILEKHQVYISGMPPAQPDQFLKKVTLEDNYGKVNIYLLPFVKPAYVRGLFEEEVTGFDMAVKKVIEREEIDFTERNILVSHQFYTAGEKTPETCESEVRMVGGIENVDAGILEDFDYAALGHIHKKQYIGRRENRYCGTPLQYSVSEAGDAKCVTVVELLEKGKEPEIREIPLKQVRQVRKLIGGLEEILQAADENNRHDFVSITLTDEVEAYQPKERLEERYDYILEIKIDNARTRKLLEFSGEEMRDLEPFAAFTTFFQEMNGRDMTEEERSLMQEIINYGEEEE